MGVEVGNGPGVGKTNVVSGRTVPTSAVTTCAVPIKPTPPMAVPTCGVITMGRLVGGAGGVGVSAGVEAGAHAARIRAGMSGNRWCVRIMGESFRQREG